MNNIPLRDDWRSFQSWGDQWLINYSLPLIWIADVKLFSVGHALELYLKAVRTKLTGDIDKSIGFGHRIKGLWQDCKTYDPQFLPMYELRNSVLDTNILEGGLDKKLSQDDFFHFLRFQELYMAARHLADLKYLGTKLKTANRVCYGTAFPNPMWSQLFSELRRYLGPPSGLDLIEFVIDSGDLPTSASAFLKPLVDVYKPA